MYAKYSDGSAVTLVKARYTRTDPQDLTVSHIPLTDSNIAIPLGLNWQTWTISGVIVDPMSIRWRDIVQLSLDNVSWRTCRYQTVGFPSNMYQQSQYELTVLVSPTLEGPIVRYPTTGYKFGNQSITGISQAGSVNAYPIIHYLAPLFYCPLSNTLIDFAGQSVTFTRTAAKVHGGVTYPINTPIFDAGLYLASDTAQDRATWTPPASAVRTVAMQIKSKPYGSGDGTNLIANGTFEVNYTGWNPDNATLSRETGVPLVGTGSLKILVAGNGNADAYYFFTTVVGHTYTASCLAKSTAAAGRLCRIAGGTSVNCSAGATPISFTFVATGTSSPVTPTIISALAGESMLVDSVTCFDLTAIPVITVWTAVYNKLTIDLMSNLLKWTDDTTTVQTTFPGAAYLTGAVVDIVVLANTANAVTVIAHAAGGAWYATAGTLSLLWTQPLPLGNLEGSIANLVQYPYVLTSAEYQALAYSVLSLKFNDLFIGNRYAGEIIKGSDKRLVNANSSDISALLGGTDIAIGASAVTIAQSQGQSARWYVEVKRTDV